MITCHYCGLRLSTEKRTRDHVIPLAAGGSHEAWNIVACCAKCNESKGCSWPECRCPVCRFAISLFLEGIEGKRSEEEIVILRRILQNG